MNVRAGFCLSRERASETGLGRIPRGQPKRRFEWHQNRQCRVHPRITTHGNASPAMGQLKRQKSRRNIHRLDKGAEKSRIDKDNRLEKRLFPREAVQTYHESFYCCSVL